jgi:hypothetical protein
MKLSNLKVGQSSQITAQGSRWTPEQAKLAIKKAYQIVRELNALADGMHQRELQDIWAYATTHKDDKEMNAAINTLWKARVVMENGIGHMLNAYGSLGSLAPKDTPMSPDGNLESVMWKVLDSIKK